MKARIPEDVRRAIERLKSLHDGERGLIEIIACGSRAIPALRALLFAREPSGIYQPRRLAARALAALEAYDALVDFLRAPHDIADAVERVGEEAVMNAAARALADVREEPIFELLMSLAHDQFLPGVIDALGKFERAEAIPHFIAALAEDESRPAAEAALRKLGVCARQSLLVVAAGEPSPLESESSLRRRRSALRLLIEIGIEPETWPVLRHLMQDRDAQTAMLACEIALAIAPDPEKREAIRRLVVLLRDADWPLSEEIERRLAAHFEAAKDIIAASIREAEMAPDDDSAKSRIRRVLLHMIEARAKAGPQKGDRRNA